MAVKDLPEIAEARRLMEEAIAARSPKPAAMAIMTYAKDYVAYSFEVCYDIDGGLHSSMNKVCQEAFSLIVGAALDRFRETGLAWAIVATFHVGNGKWEFREWSGDEAEYWHIPRGEEIARAREVCPL